jgi:hypothetical protein
MCASLSENDSRELICSVRDAPLPVP